MKNLDHYYEAHAKEIYTYIYTFARNHAITEDIVSETFYRAYLHLEHPKKKPNQTLALQSRLPHFHRLHP